MTLTSSDRESEKLSTDEASILSVPSGASSAGAVPRPSKSKLTSGTTGGSDVRPKNRMIRIIAMTSTTAIGTVIAIQISLNISSPLIPKFTIGYTTREIILLEFSSSIMALILAGKVGSNIASEIGTMRVTEQIDAMEIMGVNSANFLILPKIVGLMIFIPVLVIFSMFTGIAGGVAASYSSATDMTPSAFEFGLQFYFNQFYVWYSIIKSVVYAFIIASISAYFGYNVKGGALEVGKASTNAVVMSSIMILMADLVLTQIMLT